jgi:hypothetical protein
MYKKFQLTTFTFYHENGILRLKEGISDDKVEVLRELKIIDNDFDNKSLDAYDKLVSKYECEGVWKKTMMLDKSIKK